MHNLRFHIGYVSTTFREHVTARFLQGLFALHDKSKFEVALPRSLRHCATRVIIVQHVPAQQARVR